MVTVIQGTLITIAVILQFVLVGLIIWMVWMKRNESTPKPDPSPKPTPGPTPAPSVAVPVKVYEDCLWWKEDRASKFTEGTTSAMELARRGLLNGWWGRGVEISAGYTMTLRSGDQDVMTLKGPMKQCLISMTPMFVDEVVIRRLLTSP
jgi:hypothetical protein